MLPCNESDPNLSVAQTCAVLTPISPLMRICMWQRWLFTKLSDLQHQLPMSLTAWSSLRHVPVFIHKCTLAKLSPTEPEYLQKQHQSTDISLSNGSGTINRTWTRAGTKTKFDVFISTCSQDGKVNEKFRKMGWFCGNSRSLKLNGNGSIHQSADDFLLAFHNN